MNIKYLLSIAAASLTVSPAFAQDTTSFSGLNLAVLAGYDSVRLSAGGESGSKGDFMYGVSLGYSADLESAIIGIEAEVADSNARETARNILALGDEGSLTVGLDAYIGVRAGAKVTPNTLVYVKAGYTRARFKLAYSYDGDEYIDSDDLDGYRLGVGLEQSFGRFGVRGEYRYSDYDKYLSTGISAQRHQVLVGLVGKF